MKTTHTGTARLKHQTTALLGGIAIAGLLLTGCAGAQSKTAACATIVTELNDATAELSSGVQSISSDPASAAKSLESFSQKFSDTVGKISNDDVKKPAEAAQKSLGTLVDQVKQAAADPAGADPSALNDSLKGLEDDILALQKVCTS